MRYLKRQRLVRRSSISRMSFLLHSIFRTRLWSLRPEKSTTYWMDLRSADSDSAITSCTSYALSSSGLNNSAFPDPGTDTSESEIYSIFPSLDELRRTIGASPSAFEFFGRRPTLRMGFSGALEWLSEDPFLVMLMSSGWKWRRIGRFIAHDLQNQSALCPSFSPWWGGWEEGGCGRHIQTQLRSGLMKGKRSKQEVQEASMLIGDLTDDSLEKRINAARNLRFIAEVLGSDRVKSELLPFLRKEVVFDEGAVVCEMAGQLQGLGEVMGGGAAFALLLPLLEEALQFEEEKVRRRVTEKYYECVQLADLAKCEPQVMQSLRKLYAHDYDEVKEAFCCVAARKLGHFTAASQQQLLQNYTALAESPSPARRKYAAKYSKQLVGWLAVGEAAILRVVQGLTKDKEESNKLFLIEAVIELARVRPPATLQSYFNIISYQFTWRVRYELISKIERLAQAMGKEGFKSFLGYYIKYLNDIEPEIRSIANSKLEELIPFLEVEDIVGRVLPALKTIPQDTQPYVRNALASSLLHLCPVIGKKNTIELVLPKFLAFLKEEQEQQVKQTIFRKVHLICETLGIETLSQSVVPVLEEMMGHQNWRVRAESINILGYLIKNSAVAFLSEKVVKFVVDYLKDRANAVRKEGVRLILRLIEQHGQQWVEKNILPKLLPMFKSPTFLHRETILLALETLIPKLSPDCLGKLIFSNVFYLAQDPVENVRMSVCIALSLLYVHLPKEKDAIRKLAKNLREDKDNDVKELAVKLFAKLD